MYYRFTPLMVSNISDAHLNLQNEPIKYIPRERFSLTKLNALVKTHARSSTERDEPSIFTSRG